MGITDKRYDLASFVTVKELKALIPLMNKQNVLSLKLNADGCEVVFKQILPESVSVTTKDGRSISATAYKPEQNIQIPFNLPLEPVVPGIPTIKDPSAAVPSDSLESEENLTFDQILHWSGQHDTHSVPGTNDNLTHETLEAPKEVQTGINFGANQ